MQAIRIVLPALLMLPSFALAGGQTRPPIFSTIDARVGTPPFVVRIAGREHLVYELHVTNFSRADVTVTHLQVVDVARGTTIGDFTGADLSARLGRPGAARDLLDKRVIAPGLRAVVYLWLPLDAGEPVPSRVRHVIGVEVDRAGKREPLTVSTAESDVRRERPLVLGAPLRGGPWVALYDPALMGGHRTAIYAVNGRARIPARFAVDFVRLHQDGTHARGDRTLIANWHGYGVEVLAVADATVVEARDDVPESPAIEGATGPIPLEMASGNYITLDLGGGRYAFYEHLKHGSVRVRAGDRVKAGEVIGQLGNSGSSSSGPHLHFHVADSGADLEGEGLAYAFASFEAVGVFDDIEAFTDGAVWKPAGPAAAGARKGELPAPNSVVMFPM